MYDRETLLDEIASAIDGSSVGELSVRWRTNNGQRRVELARVAAWDPSEDEADQLPVSFRNEENAAAVAMYRRSVAAGSPLSERVLARRFGRSKTWAHDRVQEAKESANLGRRTG